MPERNLSHLPDLRPVPPSQRAAGFDHSEDGSASSPTSAMSSTPPPSPIAQPPGVNSGESAERLPHWLRRLERFLRVVVRMYLGLLICCAPWFPPAWDANPLFASSPWLLAIVTNGAVRGLVSGLGVLNLWIALRDALRNPARNQTSA